MKKHLLITLCTLLTAFGFSSVCEAQTSPQLGTHVTLTYSDGSFNIANANSITYETSGEDGETIGGSDTNDSGITMGVKTEITGEWGGYTAHQIPASAFLSDAQSAILQFVGTNYCLFTNTNTNTTVREFQWNDANQMGVTLVLTGDLLQAAKNGYLALKANGGSNYKLYVSNFATETPVREQLTDLPTIYLTVPAAINKDINDVLKKVNGDAPYYQATIQVVDNSGSLKEFTDSKLEIKVRGNSTANGMKRPYRLKFGKDDKDPVTGEVLTSHKYDLLGAGYKKRNWVLMANAFDGSMVRNALSYRVGQLVGMDFCPGWKFVDLVINEEYRGTYMVSDHLEAGKHRIDVDENTGWYIEANGQPVMAEEPYTTGGGLTLSIKNPEPASDTETATLKSAVSTFFTDLSAKFNASNSADPTSGWRSMADEESLIAFWLGVNISANYDGFMTVKMFRDIDDPRIHFGPLWDHDLAWGNYTDNLGHRIEEGNNGNFNQLMRKAWDDPLFIKKLHAKWYQLIQAGLKQDLLDYVDMLHRTIEQSEALNHQKWPTYQAGFDDSGLKTHDATIEFLNNFIDKHIDGIQDQIDAQYEALKDQMPDDGPEGEPGDETPIGELGALVDLGNGKYSYTGSASTFKEGTEITITTSENTTLNNYITEGTAWNTTKSIKLTASDVETLAANSYTFYMNATSGEVKAVNAKTPVASTGAEFNKEYTSSYTSGDFVVPASHFNANATSIKVILKNNLSNYSNGWNGNYGFNGHPWKAAYSWTTTNTQEITVTDAEDIQSVAQYGMGITGPKDMTVTVINYGTPQEEIIPTYPLTLSASEGGTVSGAGTYAEGTTVLIKAIPNTGYKFVTWSDDNTYASRSVTLKEAITLTATFAAEGSADEDPFNERGERKQLTNLPTIYLDAEVGNEWVSANLEVFDSENKLGQGTKWTKATTDVSVQYQGSGDKNKDSYRLKFEAKTQLLSSSKFKQWVLLANDDDPTMMRNALAKEMGDALGLPFTPGYQFVDLYVNNAYMGTYQVTDRIKVESGRALVTGGNKDLDWQVRFNDAGEYNEDKPAYYIEGTTSMPYIIPKNPDPKDDPTTWNRTLKSAMTSYFTNVFATDASGKYTAIAENVDKQQLIEWYIAQEMLGVYKGFSSIEAYRSVAAADQNLHIGILWDNEKAFGNTGEAPAISMADLETAGSYNGLMTNYAAYDVMKNIFTQLWQERWFANGVNNLWKEKHEAMLSAMTTKATALKAELTDSWIQNATKWNVTGEQATSISAMTAWLTQRDAYLTKKFAALAAALPCENHTYENHNYIEQTNGTFLLGCDVCGAIKEDSKTYYKFTVYPESADAIEVIATSWQPSLEHPNSIAVVEAEKNIVEKINGYNIVCGKKSTLSDGTKGLTCKAFRLTDGHPYYSDNKFVAAQATYTRDLGKNEEYGMMCIPFKHQQAVNDDAAFYHIESVDDGMIKLVAIDPTIEGNSSAYLPVIFKRKTGKTSITVKGTDVTVKKTSADKFNSTYEGWTLTGAVENQSVNPDGLFLLNDSQQGKLVSVTEANITPFRAYLSTTATDAPQTLYFVVMGDVNGDVVVDNLDVDEIVKIIVNSSSLPVNANVNFNADLDGDGKITLSDVTSLVEKLNK